MYICVIVIRGPQMHQSLTGEFDLYARAERRNVLPQLIVHLSCVWYCFKFSISFLHRGYKLLAHVGQGEVLPEYNE